MDARCLRFSRGSLELHDFRSSISVGPNNLKAINSSASPSRHGDEEKQKGEAQRYRFSHDSQQYHREIPYSPPQVIAMKRTNKVSPACERKSCDLFL